MEHQTQALQHVGTNLLSDTIDAVSRRSARKPMNFDRPLLAEGVHPQDKKMEKINTDPVCDEVTESGADYHRDASLTEPSGPWWGRQR